VVENNTTYYYSNSDGSFVAPSQGGSGYQVVAAPLGAIVQSLPPGASTVYANEFSYYYFNGTFYQNAPQGGGYQVVPAPIGAVVNSVPAGATQTTINGSDYFVYAGTYYNPYFNGTQTVYVVSQV